MQQNEKSFVKDYDFDILKAYSTELASKTQLE